MTLEREDLVDWEIPVESLTDRLNWIRNYPAYNDGRFIVPFLPEVKETLVAPDGTYTILWSKRSNVWIDEQVAEYREMMKQVARDSKAAQEAQEQRYAIRNAWPAQEQARIDAEWNSRSEWYRLWHTKPVVGRNPYDATFLWGGSLYSSLQYRRESNMRALVQKQNQLNLEFVGQIKAIADGPVPPPQSSIE